MLLTSLIALLLLSPVPVQATTTPVEQVPKSPISLIQEVFPNSDEMVRIAKCESGMRQYRTNGSVLDNKGMNKNGSYDVGLFAINSSHFQDALDRGADVFTLEGNIAYAKYLYNREGTHPWDSSRQCWSSSSEG